MSFAIVMEGMTLIAYLVILAGGVQKRATGWKILSGMLLLVGAVQLTSMSLMVSPRMSRPKASRSSVGHEHEMLTPIRRRSCTIMTIASILAGNWTTRGSCAPSAAALWSS